MLRHFSQLFSLTTPALLTTMSMWENVDLVCLKVSENCRKKNLYPPDGDFNSQNRRI